MEIFLRIKSLINIINLLHEAREQGYKHEAAPKGPFT